VTDETSPNKSLKRQLGVFDATMLGLGSIVGTGAFVSLAIATGITGPSVILATVLAGLLAFCNALSSAQLAASHPVSGGTYEYGYRYLNPTIGFGAGWMFLCAKSASAATAALGFAGYLLTAFGKDDQWLVSVALITIAIITLIVLGGIRRSNRVNLIIVSVTLFTLAAFVISGFSQATELQEKHLDPFFSNSENSIKTLLYATALMFVAYTGYGRIATLGEEVLEPRRTIPRAIISTLLVTIVMYTAVAFVAVSTVGATSFAQSIEQSSAPLQFVAKQLDKPTLVWIITIGAMTAMLGVLLNLVLGLSRVLLAMGRRGDMPAATARINKDETTPYVAVVVMGLVIAGLACIGDMKQTWELSAFTVLVYYATTNLCALRLAPDDQLHSRLFSWIGFLACLGLSGFLDWKTIAIGASVLFIGLIWQALYSKR
jgi:APA family basic amino acid/polyamine antiporter